MNAIRNSLLAAGLVAGVLPLLAAAAEPAPDAPARAQDQRATAEQQRDTERRLAEARARLEKDAAEVARLSGDMGRNFAFQFGAQGPGQPRSLLGVDLDQNGQKDGAHVRALSPGGAAADAGIKAGDIIISLGGQDLTRENDPGRALVEKMQQVEPNLKLQVGVLRDGKKMSFEVTPRPAPRQVVTTQALGNLMRGQAAGVRSFQLQQGGAGGPSFQLQQGGPGGPDIAGGPGGPGGPGPGDRRIEIRSMRDGPDDGTRFAGMEFATLSDKLGSYFGVKSGVLVVRSGANSPFKLQDGDVVLSVDGRETSSAQQAGRILRSYGPGEKLTLRVQRDRKAQNVEVTMPSGGRDGDDRDRRD